MAVWSAFIFYVKLTKSLTNRSICSNNNVRLPVTMTGLRKFSKYFINENIDLNSPSGLTLEKKDDGIIKVKLDQSRPLVVLLEYMNAREKHIKKFIDFYIDNYGFDVLQIHLKPWQLLWPTKGSQMVAKDVVEFLTMNDKFSPMVIHGFSVGGYLWGEILVHISKNLDAYQPIIDRVRCKIFDSAVDVHDITTGFPSALFPKNKLLKAAFEKYLRYHLKTFYEESTKHYVASRKEFSGGIVKCPTLMMTSDADLLSSELVNEAVRKELEALNLECHVKVFEGSTHVAHFKKHREEYIKEIGALFAKVGLLKIQKPKAKL